MSAGAGRPHARCRTGALVALLPRYPLAAHLPARLAAPQRQWAGPWTTARQNLIQAGAASARMSPAAPLPLAHAAGRSTWLQHSFRRCTTSWLSPSGWRTARTAGSTALAPTLSGPRAARPRSSRAASSRPRWTGTGPWRCTARRTLWHRRWTRVRCTSTSAGAARGSCQAAVVSCLTCSAALPLLGRPATGSCRHQHSVQGMGEAGCCAS